MKIRTLIAVSSLLSSVASPLHGKPPKLSKAEAPETPTVEQSLTQWSAKERRGETDPAAPNTASLFRSGVSGFFRDQRASRVGDIVTIKINISDSAEVGNSTSRNRSGSQTAGLAGFFGLQTLLPKSIDAGKLVDANSGSKSSGQGSIARSEKVEMTIAAIVSGVLPNGNLAIRGRQEVMINSEIRELIVTGFIRPEDIARDNTIGHSQIAEARITYGGRGQLNDAQKMRWGQKLLETIWPF